MYRSTQLLFIILLSIMLINQKEGFAQVEEQTLIESFPLSLQLYPRNLATNESIIPISGFVDTSIYKQIEIEVFRGDVLWFDSSQLVEESQPFYDHEVRIQAELVDYTFNLYGITYDDEKILLKTAERVVSGDAFLIHGQSNAVGTGGSSEPSIKADRHPFSRTFGSSILDETVIEYPYWYEARTRLSYSEGATSVWAGRLCFKTIEAHGIPCATVNGAYPGVPSTFFLPNLDDRFDLTTVYGRLLWRSRESGLQNAYRAIFWYQGEDDGVNSERHNNSMEKLFAYWAEDYPSLEHYFILQIRYGCGTIGRDNTIFEVQRQFKERENTTVLPTNGIERYDGCHYSAPGYELMADQLYYPFSEEMYNTDRLHNVVAPDILSTKQTDYKEVEVRLDIPVEDELIVEDDFHIDFSIIKNDGEIIKPINSVLSGSIITLTLESDIILTNAYLGYVGGKTYTDLELDVGSTPRIMNLNGIHLLNFWGEPIESRFLPTQIDLSSTTAERSQLLLSINLMVTTLLSITTIQYTKAHYLLIRQIYSKMK